MNKRQRMSLNSSEQPLNKRTPKVLASAEQCLAQRRMLIYKGSNDECPDNLFTEPHTHLCQPNHTEQRPRTHFAHDLTLGTLALSPRVRARDRKKTPASKQALKRPCTLLKRADVLKSRAQRAELTPLNYNSVKF